MATRASKRVARSGVADRVAVVVGDVAALPFADSTFDVVVTGLARRHGAPISKLVSDSPFGDRGARMQPRMTKLGPIPLAYRAELSREGLDD